MNTLRLSAIALALWSAAAITSPASAQPPGALQSDASKKIPSRMLGAVTATAKDTMGALVVVRALPNGDVLVNDAMRHRVLLYDKNLTTSKIVLDSAANGSATSFAGMQMNSAQLIPYGADSTLYVDVASMSLLVMDNMGKVAHVMSLPKPTDALYLAAGPQLGTARMDTQGRLVYRGVIVNQPKPPEPGSMVPFNIPEQPDSAPIVRADFDSRKVDTLARVKTIKPGNMKIVTEKDQFGIKMTLNPLDIADEWAMLSDGTIAIVRAHDYHVDFLDDKGTLTSAPKMVFDWVRLTDEQKQFKSDSMKEVVDKQLKEQASRLPTIPTPNGPRKMTFIIDFVPLKELPDYEPPITPGAVKADNDNNLWIATHTAVASPNGGMRYDVVNRKGELVERVFMPKGRALAGFGPDGAVYLVSTDGKTSVLERATLR